MEFRNIILRKEQGIASVILNRPDKLNAINTQMAEELGSALAAVADDESIGVMILKGAGRAFCSGGDVGEPTDTALGGEAPEISSSLRRIYRDTTLRLFDMTVPTIAVVNGLASGWGFDLALACDVRLGSENARFMVAFTRVGLTPATGGTWLLSRVVGLSKAAELIFTGDFLEADEAKRLGVLNRLVTSSELDNEALKLAQGISQNSPVANRLAKLQLHKGLHTDLETALELGATCQAICITSEAHKERLKTFMARRRENKR